MRFEQKEQEVQTYLALRPSDSVRGLENKFQRDKDLNVLC